MQNRLLRAFTTILGLYCFLISVRPVCGQEKTASKSRATTSAKVVQAKTLTPMLKSKSDELWAKGMARVTSKAMEDDEVFDLVLQFVDRQSKANRYTPALQRAISLLGEVSEPEATEMIVSLLKNDDFRIVMAAADTASTTLRRELIEPLMALPNRADYREHYGFRRCVMDAITRYRDKSVVEFLIESLKTTDGQLKYEIAMYLQQATGQSFGGIAGDWKKWWQSNRNDFEFARVSTSPSVALKAPPKQIPWDEQRPSFYGMTIYAKRVVFIIDRSGSMGLAPELETRLERAQREVQKAIMALSDSDSFNVVAFDDQMDVFSPRLMPANETNKMAGIEFAYRLTPRGATACYEPLKMGLEASNNLELIFFVSDGEPTSGALVEPNSIVNAIAIHNFTQRTTINALGIDARGPHEKFLKDLADKNLGKLLLVR